MAMQMLTGREVIRSHYSWQLMTKHSMWMALEHRRALEGFEEREHSGEVLVNAAEAVSDAGGSEDEDADGQAESSDEDRESSELGSVDGIEGECGEDEADDKIASVQVLVDASPLASAESHQDHAEAMAAAVRMESSSPHGQQQFWFFIVLPISQCYFDFVIFALVVMC